MSLNSLVRPSIVLEGHRDSVNFMRFNADLLMLLSGDNSGSLIVWDLAKRTRVQTIDASFGGPVTALCWIELPRMITRDEEDALSGFAVGFGTGMLSVYQKSSETNLFDLVKVIEAHDGPIEDLAFDKNYMRLASTGGGYPQVWALGSMDILNRISPPAAGLHPYICKGVHFADKGESLFVTYIESHTVMKYDIAPWTFKSSRVVQSRIGFSLLDADSLFISNLSNGIDLYSLRTMQRVRHYDYVSAVNVPVQIALAREAGDWVVMGGINGIVCVYDRATGELIHRLEHKAKGRVQVVDSLSTHETELIAAAGSNLGTESVIQLWYLKGSLYPSQSASDASPSTEAKLLKWASSFLLFGLGFVFLNALFLYVFTQYILVPYLAKGGSLQNFEQFLLPHGPLSVVNTSFYQYDV